MVADGEPFAGVDASGAGSADDAGAGGVGEDDGDDEAFGLSSAISGLLVGGVAGQRLSAVEVSFRVTTMLRLFDRLAADEGDVVSETGIVARWGEERVGLELFSSRRSRCCRR